MSSDASSMSVCVSEQPVPSMEVAASERLSPASVQSESLGSAAASGDPQASSQATAVQPGRMDGALVEMVRHLASFVQRALSDPSSLVSVGLSEEWEPLTVTSLHKNGGWP